MARLEAGDTAPPFSLPDQDGNLVALGDLVGRTTIVYFYPADDTPGCTKEACQFNENLEFFAKTGATVLGISPDGSDKHVRFRAKYGLSLTLLSDPDHLAMAPYGAWGEKTLYGKKKVGVIRSTFIVGHDGKIVRCWYNVRADGHAAKVLESLGNS